MLSTIVVIAVIVTLFAGLAWRRGLQMRNLVSDGVETQAVILKKYRFRGSSGVPTFRLRYSFSTGAGQKFEQTVSVTGSEAENYREGDNIKVTYLPDRPSISAASSMVALASQALKK